MSFTHGEEIARVRWEVGGEKRNDRGKSIEKSGGEKMRGKGGVLREL